MRRRTTVVSIAAGIAALGAALVAATYLGGDSDSEPAAARPDSGRGDVPSATPSPRAGAAEPPWLLPDMRSLDARQFQVVGEGDNRRLRFAAWLANDGPGPLLVEPRRGPGCPPGQRAAAQVLHLDASGDGVFQRGTDPARTRVPVGCMVDHRTHDHWHFDAMARYALLPVGGSQPLAARDKVSFCLRDNSRVPGSASQVRKEYYGECERDTPQGISPGWVDVYDADTPGQSLRLPAGTGDGVFCLTLEADPRGLLRETDETDNATAVAVRIVGTSARVADTDACRDAVG